ncbi:MAG: hypothetical protein ACRDPH_08795 [Marmoricola sp.]
MTGSGAHEDQTLYDALGVSRDASPRAIRRSWRRRTSKAGPGSPELGRLNEAAETLLDPEERAAYDDSLPRPEAAREETSGADGEDSGARDGRPRGRLLVGLAGLVVLALVASVLAGYFTYRHRQDEAIANARVEAPAAAGQAMQTVLAYDYRHMPKALKASLPYLTPRYGKQYSKNFHDLLATGHGGQPSPVQQTRTVVKAKVLGTAVMDAEPDLVHVLVFVDQTSRHRAGPQGQACSPCVLQNRAEVTMVKRGDSWLVDGLEPG